MVGASDADRCRWRAHQVIALVGAADQACQGAETALEQSENPLFAAIFLAGVTIGIEAQGRIRAQGNHCLVRHEQLRMAVRAGQDSVAFKEPNALGCRRLATVGMNDPHLPGHELDGTDVGKDRQGDCKQPCHQNTPDRTPVHDVSPR